MNSDYDIISIPINNNNQVDNLNKFTNIFSDNDNYYDMDEINNYKSYESINIGIYGDCGTGKTSLVEAFLGNTYNDNQVQNIECTGNKILFKLGTKKYELIIHDIAIDYNHLVPEHVMEIDAFIIMFSFDNYFSLENVEKYLDFIKMYKVQIDAPLIMVGSKTDLINNNNNNTTNNQLIQLNNAIQISQFLNLKFQDCSIYSLSVISVFNVLLLEYERKKNINLVHHNHNNNNNNNNHNHQHYNNINNNNNNNNNNNYIKSKYKKFKQLLLNKLNT